MIKTIFVHGIPEAQQRPRWGSGRFFSPKTAWWKACVMQARFAKQPMLLGPVGLIISFYFPRPKSRPDDVWHVVKPDGDNVEKATWDALKTAGWFKDDCQVAVWSSEKRYVTKKVPEPGASIQMWPLEAIP